MKASYSFFLILFFALAIGCNTPAPNSGNTAEEKKDTVYLKDTSGPLNYEAMKAIINSPLYDREISWTDFQSDLSEFDRLRTTTPVIRNAKTIAIRFGNLALIRYLQSLINKNIDSVDVFLGKYINSPTQPPPTSTPIPIEHRDKFTVMFAGKGTSQATTPLILPYNVGNPWP